MIRDGVNGCLAEGKDAFAEAMTRLIEDSGWYGNLASAARETVVSEYSQAVLGRRLAGILREVIAG